MYTEVPHLAEHCVHEREAEADADADADAEAEVDDAGEGDLPGDAGGDTAFEEFTFV